MSNGVTDWICPKCGYTNDSSIPTDICQKCGYKKDTELSKKLKEGEIGFKVTITGNINGDYFASTTYKFKYINRGQIAMLLLEMEKIKEILLKIEKNIGSVLHGVQK